VPTDNPIRSLLDAGDPAEVYPMFPYIFKGLQQAGVVDSYRAVSNSLLLTLDRTRYFSSQKIHCPYCSSQQHANGSVTYFHSVLTPVVVKPGCDKVIPLAPEFVRPQDGQAKQDCEINAAKRWLGRWGREYASLGVTVLGDDLYCHEPSRGRYWRRDLNSSWCANPSPIRCCIEWVEFLERGGSVKTLVRKRWTGKRHEIDTYRYVGAVPLRDGDDALLVNWCELTTTTPDGQVVYHNAFATSHAMEQANVVEVVAAGRSRWKIENENNNTLKTKGYHFEHNYGHGQQFLSSLLATLILLAYGLHTLLEWMDDKYPLLRQKLPSRQRLFNDIRALTTYLCFDSWDALLVFMLSDFSHPPRICRKITFPILRPIRLYVLGNRV
ncbi:MAG TPA: ISNCY family transposase, partial [Gammaproteobacteria bacterium]|nr:ISNCY family transposase [Gammaproteobacteria bacterium]